MLRLKTKTKKYKTVNKLTTKALIATIYCCAMVLLNINQLNYIKMKIITAEELLKQEETTDKICIEFALWLTKKGNYNINNWNKTMAEMLETWKKEKFKHLINK